MTSNDVFPYAMNAFVMNLTLATPHFDWGTDGLVLWIEELDAVDNLASQMDAVLNRVAFAIELQTGWDHRTDSNTYHPLYGYGLLLRDARGGWNAIRTDASGHFIELIPLEEFDYEIAYDKVMWLD